MCNTLYNVKACAHVVISVPAKKNMSHICDMWRGRLHLIGEISQYPTAVSSQAKEAYNCTLSKRRDHFLYHPESQNNVQGLN